MIHWNPDPPTLRRRCTADDPTDTISGDPREVTCPRCRADIRREGEGDHRRDQAKDRRAERAG